MKTTLVIDDRVMLRLKQQAARRGCTMSELVEAALRSFLRDARRPRLELPPLPTFDGGGFRVDVSNREALYQAIGRRALEGAQE